MTDIGLLDTDVVLVNIHLSQRICALTLGPELTHARVQYVVSCVLSHNIKLQQDCRVMNALEVSYDVVKTILDDSHYLCVFWTEINHGSKCTREHHER